jgi:hypothetical protein
MIDFKSNVKNDSQIDLIIYLTSTDDWEYWLKKEKEKSIVHEELLWEMLATLFSIELIFVL